MVHCECHEWHPVANIGRWLTRPGVGELIPARTWSQAGDISQPGHCELTREKLVSRIGAADGITCEYALDAWTLVSCEVELVDGLHRWDVADKLGIKVVPVTNGAARYILVGVDARNVQLTRAAQAEVSSLSAASAGATCMTAEDSSHPGVASPMA
jgi:hypothetical protein